MDSYSDERFILNKGQRYAVLHQSEQQRYCRVSVMDFLDANATEYVFSARPVAGTQTLPKSWVRDITPVHNNTQVRINDRA